MTSEKRLRSAEAFARRVISTSFKQTVDDETIGTVAEKIVRALPEVEDVGGPGRRWTGRFVSSGDVGESREAATDTRMT